MLINLLFKYSCAQVYALVSVLLANIVNLSSRVTLFPCARYFLWCLTLGVNVSTILLKEGIWCIPNNFISPNNMYFGCLRVYGLPSTLITVFRGVKIL